MFDFTSGMILTRKEEDDNDMTKPRGSHIHSFMWLIKPLLYMINAVCYFINLSFFFFFRILLFNFQPFIHESLSFFILSLFVLIVWFFLFLRDMKSGINNI